MRWPLSVSFVVLLFVGEALSAPPREFGPWQEFRAIYSVAPAPFGPNNTWQPVTLVTAKGDVFLRSRRPIPEEYGFVGREVLIGGREILGGPQLEAGLGTPIQVDEIRLAPGFTLSQQGHRGDLPAPGLVEDGSGAAAALGRWVMVTGVLDVVMSTPSSVSGRLRLWDGAVIELQGVPRERVEELWLPLQGDDVTVGCLLARQGSALVSRVSVSVCQGRAPRCGMLPGQAQGGRKAARPSRALRPGGSTIRPTAPRRPGRAPLRRPLSPSPYPRSAR